MQEQTSLPVDEETARAQARRERINAKARERYHANRERELARLKKWAEGNPDRRREYQQRWRAANAERQREYNREYHRRTRERDRERRKDGELRREYGLSLAAYKQMLAEQDGGCAICGDSPGAGRYLHVDHCHTANRVRGLLCSPCNVALGGFRDRVDLLEAAKTYLLR